MPAFFVLFVKMPKIILKFISILYISFLIKSTISLPKQNQSVYIKKNKFNFKQTIDYFVLVC